MWTASYKKEAEASRKNLTATEGLLEAALSFMGKDVAAFHAEVHAAAHMDKRTLVTAEREGPTEQPAKRQKKYGYSPCRWGFA